MEQTKGTLIFSSPTGFYVDLLIEPLAVATGFGKEIDLCKKLLKLLLSLLKLDPISHCSLHCRHSNYSFFLTLYQASESQTNNVSLTAETNFFLWHIRIIGNNAYIAILYNIAKPQ